MTIKFKKLDPRATIPSYAHLGDAGMDFYALEKTVLKPGERTAVRTGIAMEIPKGCAGLFWDKSGIAIHEGVKMIGGVIDASYRGEVLIGMINLGQKAYTFEAGHKVAQMLIQKVERATIKEVKRLSETSRGHGRFGSTGK